MSHDDAADEYGLEMESLVQRTAVSEKIQTATALPAASSRRKQTVILLSLFIAAIWFLFPSSIDQNTIVTDVEHLPEAENVEDPFTIENNPEVTLPKVPDQTPLAIQTTSTEPPGFRHTAPYFSSAYIRRARPDRTNSPELAAAWGAWTLQDNQTRPFLEDLYAQYPNRDVPMSQFPADAWQVDMDYLPKFIEQGIALTERAMEAILAEYGHFTRGVTHLDDAMADATNHDPAFMFNLTLRYPGVGYSRKRPPGNGGYTTETTLRRIRKQLLHSIVTEDKFFITMGGHSSSAGHGNHFTQSYTMQIQRTLEPILARLGVFHQARNIGMGGLGTAHNALASQSFYGGDNAILIWDSEM